MGLGSLLQKKNHPLFSGLFMAALLLGLTAVFLLTRANYDSQGVVATNFRSAEKISINQESVKQIFVAKNAHLSTIALAFGRHELTISPTLTLASWPDNTTLLEKTLSLPAATEIKYSVWEFSALPDSKNKTYVLNIKNPGPENIDLLMVDSDRYPEGNLLINDQKYNKNLIFHFSYYQKNQTGLLLNRLSAYKPWFFGHPAGFLILFLFYLVIITGLAWALVKNNQGDDEKH
jgi:hypothetical protein